MEQLQATYAIDVHWRAFPLHPEIPEQGGVTLDELFGPQMAEYYEPMRARLREVARQVQLPYNDGDRTYNTRRAQELAAWADAEADTSLHDALFRAMFVDGQDISDEQVLLSVVDAAGLDRQAAAEALRTRRFSEQVDADWALARQLGISAVPTFVLGERGVAGAQPYEVLEGLMEAASVARR